MVNEFKDFDTTGTHGANGINGNSILQTFDMENVNIEINVVYLLVMCLAYRILFYLFLRYFNRVTK